MIVIPPLTMVDANLVSSNIVEPDTSTAFNEATWVSGTSYTPGNVVILTSTHRKYECLTATGASTIAPNVLTSNWMDIGPTNKWAMFDLLRTSASTKTNLTVTIVPGQRIDTIAALQLSSTIDITIKAYSDTSDLAPNPVYEKKVTLQKDFTNWYDYFFGDLEQEPQAVFLNIPKYSDLRVEMTLNGTNSSCGALILGRSRQIGDIQYGANLQAQNFSTVDRDEWGNATLIQRRNIPKTSQTLMAPASIADDIKLLRDELNAQPAAWIGFPEVTSELDPYDQSFTIFGFYREFGVTLDSPDFITVNLELEEI